MRELVYDFYGSRYAQCLSRLQRLLPMLRLDMYLSPHVDTLYAAVRSKCRFWFWFWFMTSMLLDDRGGARLELAIYHVRRKQGKHSGMLINDEVSLCRSAARR